MIPIPTLFDVTPIRSLTEKESHVLVDILLAEKTKITDGLLFKESFPYKVMKRRCDFAGVEVPDWTLLWIASLCESPGDAVMWAYSLVKKTRELGEPITVAKWCELCPGVPTEQTVQELWDQQKIPRCAVEESVVGFPMDNWLDTKAAWQSKED